MVVLYWLASFELVVAMGFAPKSAMVKKAKRMAKVPMRFAAKDWSLGIAFPAAYKTAVDKCAVDPRKVVFLDQKSIDMPDAFKIIYQRLEDNYDLDVSYIGLGMNEGVGWVGYYNRCLDASRELATASVIFLADASDFVSCLPIRPETRVVQLWHACGAFKKFGMSTADLQFGGSRFEKERHPFYSNLDLVTVSSPEIEWAYREAMSLEDTPKVVQALGVSRTDSFFEESFTDKSRQAFEADYPHIAGKRIVLYAPTFRGHVSEAQSPDFIDIEELAERVGDEWVLAIRNHPFVKKPTEVPEGCEEFVIDASYFGADVALAAADAMITDYSSVVFEYSLLERPMAFLVPDLDEYNDWRGFYYDYADMTPGPKLSTTAEVADFLDGVSREADTSEVKLFKEKFMSACDGASTDRIIQAVLPTVPRREKPPLEERFRDINPSGPDISIIVPAHNAMPELTRALESVAAQTYDLDRMELIVVDDGSDDATWDEIQRFKSEHPGLVNAKKLESPSGSPAHPRNVGIEMAGGEYILFLDADDWIGPEAIERMLDHAFDWNSDVMLIKMHSENGREVPRSMFKSNLPNADVCYSKVMWNLGPCKLFRRNLLMDFDLRFFEGGMPEDLHLTIPAIGEATVVSVASDYDYYHCSWREGGGNAYNHIWDDFDANMRSYRQLMSYIRWRFSPHERQASLMRRLFSQDVVFMIEAASAQPDPEAEQRLDTIRELFADDYTARIRSHMPEGARRLLDESLLKQNIHPALSAPGMPRGNKVHLDFITRSDDKLVFEGRLTACAPQEDVHLFAMLNGEFFHASTFPRFDNRDGDDLRGESFTDTGFLLEVPCCKGVGVISFIVSIDGRVIKADMEVGKLCPISFHRFDFSVFGDVALCTVGKLTNQFELVERNNAALIAREALYEANIIAGNKPARKLLKYRRIALEETLEGHKGKEIWLISDRTTIAGDNGEALFAYLSEHPQKDVEPVFVISKDSPDFERMKQYGRVVDFGSDEHIELHMRASKVISSAADDFVFNRLGRYRFLTKNYEHFDFVFLQHGVTQNDISSWLNRYNKNIALFITVSQNEYDSIVNNPAYAYDSSRVALSGFPRHDSLLAAAKLNQPQKKVLIAPTWRDNIAGAVNQDLGTREENPSFEQSEYFSFFNGLLNDKRLEDAAFSMGFEIDFLIHPAFAQEAHKFSSPFARIATEYNYREEFLSSALMLTDYSSVAFDFALLKRPVLYTHFDWDSFYEVHPWEKGYFRYETDGFGDICSTLDETIDRLIELMENPTMDDKYKKRVDAFFHTTSADYSRCQAVVDAINNMR